MTTNIPESQLVDEGGAPEHDPRDGGCLCQRCGIRYKVDLSLSDDLWAKIHGEHNLLCGICITRAIEGLGNFDWFIVQQGDAVVPELVAIGEAWNRGRRHEYEDIRNAINGLTLRGHVFGHECYFKNDVDSAIAPPEDSAIADTCTPSPDSIREKAERAARVLIYDDDYLSLSPKANRELLSKVVRHVADIIAAEFGAGENNS